MKYTLDKNEILKKMYLEIKKLDNKNLSEAEKDFISLDIDSYEAILCDLFSNKNNNTHIKKEDFIEQACEISNKLLTKTQRNIYKSTFPFLDKLNELNDFTYQNKKNILTINDQKELILDNYLIPDNIKNEINELFNPKNKRLFITKSKEKNYTYPFFNGECYMSCTNKDDIYGFISLCHEMGHFYEHYASCNRINKLVFSDKDNIYNYKEVASIFYELLSIKILIDNNLINKNEFINNLRKIKYDDFNDPTIWLIFDEISKTKKISYKDFKYLKKEYSELYDATIYSYSYIIAVNLFEQCLTDKKDAFNNLKYLINNISTKNEKEILKNCNITYLDTNLFEKHIKRMKK